ncbi:hypothetical protein CJD36_003585 [Flavipsychrobacter stenotrophus]|uniref:DoxX family protein n=1 Tax=Flavipsychrobacter stenotrophus TaxID=2077091 RepID=A0A2S7T1W2_9BACT|nr:hypothetical protein [Flavipsychrobacter stenotrophus]PQJ12837.1 hypothetical protein CJD36_003585 [Flavipsychrobacter stenotrophus]
MANLLKSKALYLGVVRYLLAVAMISYAVPKILGVQCIVKPFYVWQLPLEQLSGSQLMWAFLGHSLWFQALLGLLELVPSILLFFRRTALLGAILLLPVSLNIFLINHALNVWVETKILSGILLSFNLLVFAFEWKKVVAIIHAIFPGAEQLKGRLLEFAINSTVLICLLIFLFKHASPKIGDTNVFTGDWRHGHPNEWILEGSRIRDNVEVFRQVKLYFQPEKRYYETDSNKTIGGINYILNEKEKSLEILTTNRSKIAGKSAYTFVDDSTVKLYRLSDGGIFYLKRRIMNGKHP